MNPVPFNMWRSSSMVLTRLLSSTPRTVTGQDIKFPKSHKWNRAVDEAEQLVGFPTSLVSLRTLMSDEVTSMATHMRKLMGSDHPVLKTLKRLLYHERNNLQVRGLMALLLARAFNKANPSITQEPEFEEQAKVLIKQRQLAEYLEMIYSAQQVHRSVLNLPHDFHEEPQSEMKDDLLRLEYGNKIAILGGDYLLANACTGLAALRNTFIVEMVSRAIADFTQAEFLGPRDIQGRFVPTPDQLSLESWLHRNTLAYGSLMSNTGKAMAMLANLSEAEQEACHQIGHHLSLALQAFTELEPFCDEHSVNLSRPLDLAAAPVLFHLQSDPDLLKYIQDSSDNLESLDSRKIYESVRSGSGLQMTQELCRAHARKALKGLEAAPKDEAVEALTKIINHFDS